MKAEQETLPGVASPEWEEPEKELGRLCMLGQALRELVVRTRRACLAPQQVAMTESQSAHFMSTVLSCEFANFLLQQ